MYKNTFDWWKVGLWFGWELKTLLHTGEQCFKKDIFVSKGVYIQEFEAKKVTEIVVNSSSNIISVFWLWIIWRNSGRFFYLGA